MFHNYFFLRRLSKRLGEMLVGGHMVECFSQNKDELLMQFVRVNGEPLVIKASLEPQIGLLSFPDGISRARKNSIDLFPEILNASVSRIHQFTNERSFSIVFTNDFQLIFKMHGRRSNILLTHPRQVHQLFRNTFKQDLELNPEELSRELDFQNESDLQILAKIMGPELRNAFGHLLTSDQGHALRGHLDGLWDSKLHIVAYPTPNIAFLPPSEFVFRSMDPIEISNKLFHQLIHKYFLQEEKNRLLNESKRHIKRLENYILKNEKKIKELSEKRSYEEVANIIMANLHAIPKGATQAQLFDFYRNEEIEIKLKAGSTPQRVAENYYRKSKNRRIEIDTINRNIAAKKVMLQELLARMSQVETAESTKELKRLSETHSPVSPDTEENLPYHEVQFDGYRIWIGKNARSNDELTLKFGKKNDLWLHARDVAGSHVLVKEIPGRKFPKHVIERAAAIAAYASKRRTDSLCPVIYTPRKYVRKKKGTPAGLMFVEREDVILVKPHPPS